MYLADSSLGPLSPSLSELIIGTIAFLIVFGVLWRILLPRIQQTLEERTDQIEGGLQRAEEAQAEAKQTLEQYQAQLADARHEASRLRQEAQEEGARILAELRERGEAERQRLVTAAHEQIEADRAQAIQALRTEMGALADARDRLTEVVRDAGVAATVGDELFAVVRLLDREPFLRRALADYTSAQ